MNIRKYISVMALQLFWVTAHAQSLTYEQVLQRVIDHYPSLKTAALQVRRAEQETARVNSQLGWNLGAEGGIARDVSTFGIETDRLDAVGRLSRQLQSGETLSLSAGLNYEDAESAFAPTLPNPSTSTRVDVNYRIPLKKGADNPGYSQSLVNAEAGLVLAEADKQALYDQIAGQLITLYYSTALTLAQMDNVRGAIRRNQRLYDYIRDRENLGLSEDKDVLQVSAILSSLDAELKGLEVELEQQVIGLNRLMGRDWNDEIDPILDAPQTLRMDNRAVIINDVNNHSPSLQRIRARLKLADAAIQLNRDSRQDLFDVVLFAGTRTYSGDAAAGDVDENNLVGGVRLEFNESIDKSGFDAELYQAQLDRSIALQEQVQVMEDLQYDVHSLVSEIRSTYATLRAYRDSIQIEQQKLDDAVKRYRQGRADTDQLIQFEGELSSAELKYELKRIELALRLKNLELLRGKVWVDIMLPDYVLPELQLEQE